MAATLFGGNYALTYYAETGIASGLVAVLFGTLPFFLFGFGALLLGERIGVAAIAGAAIALAGVATISLGADTHGSLLYVLAALGAAAISAYANVTLKRFADTDPFRTLPPAMLLARASRCSRSERRSSIPTGRAAYRRGRSPLCSTSASSGAGSRST